MVEKKKLKAAIEEDLLKPLGLVSANFALLEETLSFAIWLLLVGNSAKEQRTGQIVTTRMSFREKIILFEALYKHRLPEKDLDGFRKIKRRLKRANEKRNSLLHSTWLASGEKGSSMRSARHFKEGAIDFEFEKMSAKEIEKRAHSIAEVSHELQAFFLKF